jgi:hypothetical protein
LFFFARGKNGAGKFSFFAPDNFSLQVTAARLPSSVGKSNST